jgi:hypothetical protein
MARRRCAARRGADGAARAAAASYNLQRRLGFVRKGRWRSDDVACVVRKQSDRAAGRSRSARRTAARRVAAAAGLRPARVRSQLRHTKRMCCVFHRTRRASIINLSRRRIIVRRASLAAQPAHPSSPPPLPY